MSVSRSEIIKRISKNFPNLFIKDINKLLNVFLYEITKALSNGERVELRDTIGTFETRVQIIYKSSKEWKNKINEKK